MKIHAECPHCAGRIQLDLRIDGGPTRKPKGPPPYNPGPEIDAFVIDAIENRGFSYRTTAELLQERKVRTASGGLRWYGMGVKRLYENALSRRSESDHNEYL